MGGRHFSQKLGREFRTNWTQWKGLRELKKKLAFLHKHERSNLMISVNSGLGFSIYNLFDLGQ